MSASRKSIEAEGETIDEALAGALAGLGISRDQAEVEILQDARRGVFGFGAQRARVRVSLRTSVGPAERSGPLAMRDATSMRELVPADAYAVLQRVIGLMGFHAKIDSAPGEHPGEICLRISSDGRGLLIGRHGQTLDALEYLLNRIVGLKEEGASRIVLDAEGYRDRRRRELAEAARRLAARVRETGRPEAMDPLTPRERRVVHLSLADDPTVSTRSDGEGALRHVVIFPEHASQHRGSTRRGPRTGKPVD